MNMPEMPAPMMIASNSVLLAVRGRSMSVSESFIRISLVDVQVGLATEQYLTRVWLRSQPVPGRVSVWVQEFRPFPELPSCRSEGGSWAEL